MEITRQVKPFEGPPDSVHSAPTVRDGRVFVVTEEQGRNGYGHTLYLDETEARRLRTALATALREFGADPGT